MYNAAGVLVLLLSHVFTVHAQSGATSAPQGLQYLLDDQCYKVYVESEIPFHKYRRRYVRDFQDIGVISVLSSLRMSDRCFSDAHKASLTVHHGSGSGSGSTTTQEVLFWNQEQRTWAQGPGYDYVPTRVDPKTEMHLLTVTLTVEDEEGNSWRSRANPVRIFFREKVSLFSGDLSMVPGSFIAIVDDGALETGLSISPLGLHFHASPSPRLQYFGVGASLNAVVLSTAFGHIEGSAPEEVADAGDTSTDEAGEETDVAANSVGMAPVSGIVGFEMVAPLDSSGNKVYILGGAGVFLSNGEGNTLVPQVGLVISLYTPFLSLF